MSRSRYKIGVISALMGMTSEALRYYEREGIITPEKDGVSGYRMYTAWDLHILIRIRMFRRYGMTLEESAEALSCDNVQDVVDVLGEKEKELAQTIDEQQRLLARLHRDRRAMLDAQQNVGKFRVEMSPAMYFLATQRSYNFINERVKAYGSWIEKVPYVGSGGIFDVPGKVGELRYGLLIDADQVEDAGVGIMEEATFIPSQKCLVTFFLSGSEEELCLEKFDPAMEFLVKNGLTRAGMPFAKARSMRVDEQGNYHSIYQGWIPFEGESHICSPVLLD